MVMTKAGKNLFNTVSNETKLSIHPAYGRDDLGAYRWWQKDLGSITVMRHQYLPMQP